MGLAGSNLDRLGTGVLTQSQREELALKMIAGKRAEFLQRTGTLTEKEQLKPLPNFFIYFKEIVLLTKGH